jgi:hypothetical protein
VRKPVDECAGDTDPRTPFDGEQEDVTAREEGKLAIACEYERDDTLRQTSGSSFLALHPLQEELSPFPSASGNRAQARVSLEIAAHLVKGAA